MHASDDGHPVYLPGEIREVFTDVVAGNRSRQGSKRALDLAAGIGLQVKSVDMAQSPPGEDHDTAARLAEPGRTCPPACTRLVREGQVGG